jgi:hypothetical protein
MPRIAVSGHRGLPPQTVALVDQAIRANLTERDPAVVGLTCLADGADQNFARAVLDTGGSDLEKYLPLLAFAEFALVPEDGRRWAEDLARRAELRPNRGPHRSSAISPAFGNG